MAEYIEREKVYHKLTGVCDGYCHGKMCKYTEYMLEEIEDIPTADVQPVRRGRWIITDDVEHFIAVCSECGRTEDSRAIKDMPYCHCGADMRGEGNEV